jgi:hypothetical protein
MHGAMADGEGWLVAAALAGVTRGFLSPWRHHALLRDAPRPDRRPDAKEQRLGQRSIGFASLWRAGGRYTFYVVFT